MNLVGKYIGKKVGKSMSLTDKIIELCSYDDEQEWFEEAMEIFSKNSTPIL